MRILIDITHPAHAHFFRNPITDWRERGHELLVTSRDKDINLDLLDRMGIDHQNLGSARSGLAGLAWELPVRTTRLCAKVRRFRPDVMAAIGGTFIAQASWICRVPSVVFYDTENAWISNLITYPVSTAIVTPRCYEGWVPRSKHLTYAGYHEIAYTHPRRFEPDATVLERFGLEEGEPFIFLRLVSWGAAHDVTDHGLTRLEEAVRDLAAHGRVLISSERELPPDLEPLRLTATPELVHHLLYYARLFIGESATMASEAATLGTPSVFISTSVRGYTNEQERRYGLTFTFSDPKIGQQAGLAKALEILSDSDGAEAWSTKRTSMLADVIDVSAYVVETVETFGLRENGPPDGSISGPFGPRSYKRT